MADINNEGGWLGNGTHTVPNAIPGVWKIDNPHGATVAVSRRATGTTTGTAAAYSDMDSDGAERVIPAGTELAIVISDLSDDEKAYVGRVAALTRHMLNRDPD